MACYGNEKEGAATIHRAMGVTLCMHLIKGYADAVQSRLALAPVAESEMLTLNARISRSFDATAAGCFVC